MSGVFPHGGAAGYVHLRCRCDDCRIWNRDRQREITKRLRERGLTDDDPRHGTQGGYGNWGCRCPDCTAANTEWSATWRARQR